MINNNIKEESILTLKTEKTSTYETNYGLLSTDKILYDETNYLDNSIDFKSTEN